MSDLTHVARQLNEVPPYQQPYPLWFWNGEMAPDEIRRQIDLLRNAGLTEFVVHARTGLQTPFLSENWFTAVGVAVAYAAQHGMRCWIYDEYNWPSGTAGETITRNPACREHFIAPDGSMHVETGAYHAPHSVDYLNPACTDAFIAACYQSYFDRFGQYFGATIPGFFNDEARFCNPNPWSPSLDEPFPLASAYRRLGELITERHFQKIRDWCTAHQVLFTGHVMGEETLGSQTRFMGNAWNAIACYHWAGFDHLGSACWGHHPRLATSIAHLRGQSTVTCETFGGCPWDMTPDDLYRIAGWLYANGVTRIIFHGFFYTRDGEAQHDWPPDLFFRWEHWDDMPAFVQWAGRVQHFLDRTAPVARVALYYPHAEFCADFTPDPRWKTNFDDTNRVMGETARRYHLELGRLMNELVRRQIDFDLVPTEWLATVHDRVLLTPYLAAPDFDGTVVAQGKRTAEVTLDEVEARLGRRVRVTGPFSEPRPRAVSDAISDPYLHEGRDDGGVLVRSLRFEGRPAVWLWNANTTEFVGECDLAVEACWVQWTPADGAVQPMGRRDSVAVRLAPNSAVVFLAQ